MNEQDYEKFQRQVWYILTCNLRVCKYMLSKHSATLLIEPSNWTTVSVFRSTFPPSSFPRRHFENAILSQGTIVFHRFRNRKSRLILSSSCFFNLRWKTRNGKRLLPKKRKGKKTDEKEFQLLDRVYIPRLVARILSLNVCTTKRKDLSSTKIPMQKRNRS